MTPDALAGLHRLAFTDTPRPWGSADFARFLDEPTTVIVMLPDGFALGRVAGAEAELLTLAVHPNARGRGVGADLLRAFEAEAMARGAGECLLEVATNNEAACALYARLAYQPVGRRTGYYRRRAAPSVDALILRKLLTP